jgi:Tfp pilus assembly PilM family ATPase
MAQIQAAAQMSQFTGDSELTLQTIDSQKLYQKQDGRALESSIAIAYSPETHLQQLSKNLKELDLNLWAVTSLMFVLAKRLANNSPKDFNAIIIDIGGKVTDIAVVFGGGVWGTRPLPIGGETFTNALIKNLVSDYQKAEEDKIAYAQRQMREEKTLKIKKALEPAVNLWLSGVETALQNFEGIKTFPRRIILTGGGARLEQLKEHLSDYPLMKTLPFASPPAIEVRTDVGPGDMELIAKDIISERTT